MFKFLCVILLLISGLRDTTIGVDLQGYVDLFLHNELDNRDFLEPGYLVFSRFMHFICPSPFFYILTTTCLVNIPIFYVITRKSVNPIFSLLVYVIELHYFFSFSVVRQCIAISMCVLALYYLIEDRFAKSIIWCILACSFHSTAYIFLLVYVLKYVAFKPKIVNLLLILSTLAPLFIDSRSFFMLLPQVGAGTEYLAKYSDYLFGQELPVTRILLSIIPGTIVALLIFNDQYKGNRVDIIMKVFILGTILNNIFITHPIGFRILKPFIILSVILIPNYIFQGSNVSFKRKFKNYYIFFYLILYAYNLYARMVEDYPNDIVPYRLFGF